MRRSVMPVLVAATLVFSACRDDVPTSPIRTPRPSADVQQFGNGHFYFLQPLVEKMPTPTGTVNTNVAPTVEVCAGTQLNGVHCAALVAKFTRFGGVNNFGDVIGIQTDGTYAVEWHTANNALTTGNLYRIVVLVGETQLGYADVKPRGNKPEKIAGVYDFENGRTVPVKFRIEHGALCPTGAQCFENMVGPNGGTFVFQEGGYIPAGVEFPANALQETTTLIIERYNLIPCLPTPLQQFAGCFRFRLEPAPAGNFAAEASVGVCMTDPAGVPFFSNNQPDNQLRLWKWSETAGDALQELERTEVFFLNCPPIGFASARPTSFRLAASIGRLLQPIASLILPSPAYAFAGYEGGKLSNFSRIGWVRPLALDITQGNNQTGVAGGTLPVQPTVLLRNKYGPAQAVSGWSVGFQPSGNGSASPTSAITGANGLAATSWTLSTTPGANTLLASVVTEFPIAPAPYSTQATFNATGLAQLPDIAWLGALAGSSPAGLPSTNVSGETPFVVIMAGGVRYSLRGSERPATDPAGPHYYVVWSAPTNLTGPVTITVENDEADIGTVNLIAENGVLKYLDGTPVFNLGSAVLIQFRIL